MPGIGSLISEIAVTISEMWESKQTFAQKNQASRSKCFSTAQSVGNSRVYFARAPKAKAKAALCKTNPS